nr:unnamed protein product [Callosobruchus analis]
MFRSTRMATVRKFAPPGLLPKQLHGLDSSSTLLPVLRGCVTLRLTDLRIPSHAVRNQSVKLECYFDLDGETLYSVKWYKDGNEFFRYVPRDMPPTQSFSLPGVTVDMHNSTKNVVVLNSVQLSSTGIYRCEVSGEAPFFETVTDHERMVVVVPIRAIKIHQGGLLIFNW